MFCEIDSIQHLGNFRVVLLTLLCVLVRSEVVWLSLPATGTKCVSNEIHNNVVVLADYVVISDDHIHPTPTISAKVDGNYSANVGSLSINMEWKTGVAVKDWESVARKEKIEGIELELRKLEDVVKGIHENISSIS
ncbi:hypothetical protein ACS0TY_018279 [Phlomoides rotata]